jgi:hypothetical protein
MPVISCSCGKTYRLQDGLAGRSFRCKACQAKLTVPPDGTGAGARATAVEALRPAEVDRSLVCARNTEAGNPGLLSVSLRQLLRCYPAALWAGAAAAAVAGGMLLAQTRSVAIAGVAVPFMFVVVVLGALEPNKKKFRSGNLCAALVIETNPYRVAVLTDLSNNRSGPKLAVAIRNQPLTNMFGGPPAKNAQLVAVCLYFGSGATGHWDDVMPTVINCGCNNPAQIKRAAASVDAADWELLSQTVPRLPSRAVGLYKLWELSQA